MLVPARHVCAPSGWGREKGEEDVEEVVLAAGDVAVDMVD